MIATVVAAPSGGRVSVQMPGQDDPILIVAARAVEAAKTGESVVVWMEGAQAIAVALLGVATVATTPPPAAIPNSPPPVRTVETRKTVAGSTTLGPTWTGTWRGGAWRTDTSDLYQGDWTGRGANSGAAFIDGWDALGTITGATVHLERVAGAGNSAAETPRILLLGSNRSTGAFPTTLAESAGPALAGGATAEWAMPSGWLPQLQSGAATGIGIRASGTTPYLKLSGSRLWVAVDWERTS